MNCLLYQADPEIGRPPTDSAGRMKLSCVVPESVIHIWPIHTSWRKILLLSILTVRHILVKCKHFAQERKNIFGRRDVVESFRSPTLCFITLWIFNLWYIYIYMFFSYHLPDTNGRSIFFSWGVIKDPFLSPYKISLCHVIYITSIMTLIKLNLQCL